MDELTIAGKKYISSRRASEITGYAKDYVGQLARAGKIPATRIGRAWYVDEDALLLHENAGVEINSSTPIEGESLAENGSGKVSIRREYAREKKIPTVSHALLTLQRSLPSTWTPVSYSSDEQALFPISFQEDSLGVSQFITVAQNKVISANQEKNNLRIRILRAKTKIQDSNPVSHLRRNVPAEKKQIKTLIVRENKVRPIRVKAKNNSLGYFALALSSATLLALVLGSGFFIASHIIIAPQSDLYTANVYLSYHYVAQTIGDIPSIHAGYTTLKDFLFFILNSPQVLFLKGIDFFKSLIDLV